MKCCLTCGVEKRKSEFYFRRDTGKLRNACKKCDGIRVQSANYEYYWDNREKVLKNTLKWMQEHPQRVKAYNLERTLKKLGMSALEYTQMRVAQSNQCAICKTEFNQKVFPNLDHCHKSGVIRGLLCTTCNTGLGMFRDDSDFLRAAIQYLGNHG